jgi:hypothetical protein
MLVLVGHTISLALAIMLALAVLVALVSNLTVAAARSGSKVHCRTGGTAQRPRDDEGAPCLWRVVSERERASPARRSRCR